MVLTDHTHLLFQTRNSQTCLSSPVIVLLTVPKRRFLWILFISCVKIVSEYDQEIPQPQTANKPMAPRGGANNNNNQNTAGRQTKQSN